MGAVQLPASTLSDDWVLISSVTPTNGASTLSFTSIGQYRKLMLAIKAPGFSGSTTTTLTFNGDTAGNYSYSAVGYSASAVAAITSAVIGSQIPLGTATSGNLQANFTINETNTAGAKNISGWFRPASVLYPNLTGVYFASAAITSMTITCTSGGTFENSGTVALYGVAA
jgi:hypothetical protein